jgi:Ca-activated chloride channel family protein
MLRLAHIEFIYVYAVIPVLILIYLFFLKQRKKSIRSFAEVSLFKKLTEDSALSKKNLKFILQMLALCFVILALVDPETGSHLETVETKGSDIVIALDVSNSMNAQDLMPSRLEKAKQAVEKLISQLHGDRLGIVVFAGQPFIQLPLTSDYQAAKMFLQTVSTNMIPVQGTSIGSAIEMSADLFNDQNNSSSGRNKAIVLITDGENFQDDALQAAKTANANNGIVFYTIGMGSPEGAPIPVYSNGQLTGYKKDKDGNTVTTKLDLNLLQQIAGETGGICIRASNNDAGMDKLSEVLNKKGGKAVTEKKYRDFSEQFEFFIVPALLLLIIDLFVTEKKTKWYQRLNLFGKNKPITN